ncbi:hypothetical protein JOF29_003459 [Kribbella aluminosa]|uniref:Uncharacterized protein n=1 Tax=Kribbella aluminosa TaxID=416017 RepID=A0ABS4ULD0_9ACTN|nr:hypothetical protein [Kribbella aluminosa]MBP2352376.1 hypothetical protein [Kribbella aluminosa]
MQREQVDVVGAEPAQRVVEGADQVLAAVAARVRVAGVDAVGRLGGEHHPLLDAGLGDQPADDPFALARGVEVGGVDEVAAGIDSR